MHFTTWISTILHIRIAFKEIPTRYTHYNEKVAQEDGKGCSLLSSYTSSSSISKAESISNLPQFLNDLSGERHREETSLHSLQDIAEHFRVNWWRISDDVNERNYKQVNDRQDHLACNIDQANSELLNLQRLQPMTSPQGGSDLTLPCTITIRMVSPVKLVPHSSSGRRETVGHVRILQMSCPFPGTGL